MAQPVALYGLEIPPGDVLIPASPDFPATVSIFLASGLLDWGAPACESLLDCYLRPAHSPHDSD